MVPTPRLRRVALVRPPFRVAGLAVVLLLLLNAVVLAGGYASDDGTTDLTTGPDVAAAAVALASSAQPAVEADLDPLAGIVLAEVDVALPVDPDAVLPVPLVPPSNPYAPTPEVRHGTLRIPSIGLEQTLFEGVTLTAINRGPSHWPGSAMPGELGNVVVAGHRTTYSRPFWDLQAVEPGDELIFDMADGQTVIYELDRIEIVAPTDVHIIEQRHEYTATLFACHPRGSARQRIVGHFRLKPETRAFTAADSQLVPMPGAG